MRKKEELNEKLKLMIIVAWILKIFPGTHENAISEKYPIVAVDAVKHWYKVKGHHDNAHDV